MSIRTYSLTEVAAMALPQDWKCPERWLARRLRTGEISGYKVGHDWRMTEDDVRALIESHRNSSRPSQPEPCDTHDLVSAGLSARATRRSRPRGGG